MTTTEDLRLKLLFILNAEPGATIAFVGRTIDDLRRDVIEPIRAAFPESAAAVTYRRGSLTADILGRHILLVATNRPGDADRIRGGVILAGYYATEPIPQHYADLLTTRVRRP